MCPKDVKDQKSLDKYIKRLIEIEESRENNFCVERLRQRELFS